MMKMLESQSIATRCDTFIYRQLIAKQIIENNMEILEKFQRNGYFTAEVYHLLVKKKMVDETTDIQPSEYQREMTMTTQQRLQSLNNIDIDNLIRFGDNAHKVVLSFTPKLLVFQNFKANEKIVAKFSVKNISKSPTYINMVFKESTFFTIKPSGGVSSRLAPGISINFFITFMPEHEEDYTQRVTFFTDVDQYIVPLIAMGPRPIFDFPDKIDIPKTPLKVENCIVLPIHNVGVIPASFTLSAKCPFSVKPKFAHLKPKESVNVEVKFKTVMLGESFGHLHAIFEKGEHFKINVSGMTYTVSIELEKQVVRFFDTYNTMVRQQTFKIVNKSDHVLTYMCMKNECIYFDFQEKVHIASMYYNLQENEAMKSEKLVHYDVLSSDEHERVYTRIFFDEVQSLVADESLHFRDSHFSMMPITGNLWPNKATELTIIFSPKAIGELQATAYLDIDGVYDRVPLSLIGISIPPTIHLNIETLDMDCVYISKPYNYEIVAINKGHINGVIEYKEVPTLFGSIISCSPLLHCLRPGDKDIFIISFCNANQGPYFEEVNFTIRDTDVVIKLYLKGEVIYPSLCFSIPCLDFGKVSIGLPKTLQLDVINESDVSINANVHISSDGPEVSSITLEDFAVAMMPKPQIPQWPREFNIEPCKVEIASRSRFTLKITLIANLIRANQTSLELEVDKSDSPPITLPIMFVALVPEITPAADIKLRACFLDYTYINEVVVTANEFWGYFTLERQEPDSPLQVEAEIKEGYIKPNSTLSLKFHIMTSVLGLHEYSVRMKLFGMTKPFEICHITGCGVRPIVTCSPSSLHWGQVKLLNTLQKTLTLCNDSPVVVYYRATVLHKDGRWQITPSEGFIPPESETELVVTLYLIDANIYSNKAVVQLEKVKDILVPLSATGVGTSIIVGSLCDRIALGRHFTKIPLRSVVIMENRGTRMHMLEWSEHYKAPKTKLPAPGFFNLEPRSFKMAAGEKIELLVTGISHKMTTVNEMWYLVGSVEGINKKELLLECEIEAEFVDPKIEISSTTMEFQFDYGPYSEYYNLTDIVTIENVSRLPLDLEVSVKPPFAMIQRHDTYIVPTDEEKLCSCIQYRASDLDLQKLLQTLGPRESQLFIDCLTSKPVEKLRKTSLDFFRDIHKIKLAFNLTHMIEERLEDRQIMKLQLLFDTTKHASLKSKVFCDLLRIKFKGHKNKDAVKVVGNINYPNILVLTPRIDFQCIQNGTLESRTIKVQNVTPVLVCYRLLWKKCKITSIQTSDYPTYVKKDYPSVSSELPTEDTTPSGMREILSLSNDKPEIISPQNPEAPSDQQTNMHTLMPDDHPPEACFSGTHILTDIEYMKMRTMQKITPMIHGKYDTKFQWLHKFAKKTKCDRIDMNSVMNLIPHRGLLKPGEIQYIHVIFKPTRNISVRGILECDVLGGPPESILVTGKSSDLIYKLNTERLNFKIRSFHENAIEELVLTNIAELSFEYKTYLIEDEVKNELAGNILELLPPQKVLEPKEQVNIQVVVYPGVLGSFNKVFLLELGYLPHIPIEVYGWGVIPQIYLSLNRTDQFTNLDPRLGYEAIQLLTNEYLCAVSEIFAKCRTAPLNSPLTDKCFEDPDFKLDWHLCSIWDGYPSTVDIELAIERLMVMRYIKERPELMTAFVNTSKSGPISGFYAIPYVIDFGVVITGSTIQCIAEVVNYGPIATKLCFAKGTRLPPWLSMKLCGKLNPGETGKLEVVFAPTSVDFVELEQNVELALNLEVTYGVSIPIHIKALCAVPYLVSNVKTIDFGSVRCGDKIMTSIPLKNVGKPTCIWFVTLKLKVSGPPPMTIMNSSGVYDPGQGGWLTVAFKPTTEMLYEGLLIFRCHMNPNRFTIPVIGHGIVPAVHVIGPNVNFPPTLPWAETTYIYFGLTNPCPFPIELIFAHSDEYWQKEEAILQLLFKYYGKPDEILIPAVQPGCGLPQEIVNFCSSFFERVEKLVAQEALGSAKSNTPKSSVATKKAKPTKVTKAPGSQKENSPIKFRTEAEIIADEIKLLKERGVDPIKACFTNKSEAAETENTSEKNLKGLLIFAHGSPAEETQCQEYAYSVGKVLGLPVVNIDHCIVDALLNDYDSTVKDVLRNAINDSYEITVKNTKNESMTAEQDEDEFDETQDEFEKLLKKILCLANNRNVQTPRAKAAAKAKKKSTTSVVSSTTLQAFGSSTLFQMDLVQDLLAEYFQDPKFERGFVVETLTSIVMKNPSLVITTVLKCKSNIWNAHLLLCQSDFTKWAQLYEESHKEAELVIEIAPKVYEEFEILDIVQQIEEMNEEEFENVPPELKAIYIEHGLEQRRKKYHSKILSKRGLTSPSAVSTKEKTGKESRKDSVITVKASDSKKIKAKKDETKVKASAEYTTMNLRYTEYTKNVYDNLICVASNWIFEIGDMGSPLYNINGQVGGGALKKNKKKSDIQLQNVEVGSQERGFPITLIMYPCDVYKDAIINMFKTSPTVQTALKVEELFDILQCPVNKRDYTVLLNKTLPHLHYERPLKWRFLEEIPIKKCECNQLTDINLLDDTTQDNVLMVLSKWHCTCGKKLASSQTFTSDVPSTVDKLVGEDVVDEMEPLPLYSVKSVTSPRPNSRIILQPGDLVRCKYSFSPQDEGNFHVKRYVEVSGWPDSRVEININAICDLPRLDSRPKKMFENFVRRTIEDHVYKITFLDDLKVFEFGPIFVGINRIYEERYTIDLKNSSLITADVDIEFLEDTPVFQIDKTYIVLEPGCRGKLTISAAPAEEGVHTSSLLFCVKDNPAIVTVSIACSGVNPFVEILPVTKTIEYGKLLLYRRKDDRFIVKNESILPIKWQIRNVQDFSEDFIISKSWGIVLRHDNQVVPITYIACRVIVINNKPLIIDIYDSEGRGDPLITETLYLSAECYDVMVDCAYEKPNENYLNYGNVKVNSTVYQEMFLLNRGKYNIYFKLKKVKNFPEPSLLKSFVAVPECGVMPATMKLLSITFECTPTTSMNLCNVPAYICTLLDNSKEQLIVAKFPVCVSIASFYNTFTLFPLGELNFHIIPVGTAVLREVILNNTSKCPVTYEIILPPEYRVDPNAPVPVAKTKDNKIKNPPLKCGSFIIMNEDNLLAPGTSRTIQIQFFASLSKTFVETINFVISDTCPAEAQGVPLRLVGTGAMPTLDFWNIETTFREHLIVKNLSEYKVHESSPHCVFVESSVTLHFFCITVKSRFTGYLDLYNNGLVSCALTMKLNYQANTNESMFSLDRYETHIEPLMHRTLGIIFTPHALVEYRAVLEIKLKLLDNQEKIFKLCLIGEGVIPRIEIVAPQLRRQKQACLRLPVTCLGSVSNGEICLKNISALKSIVIADVTRVLPEKRPIFWITAPPELIMAHKIDSRAKPFSSEDEFNITLKLVLKPGETATITIHYNPIRKGRTSCDVNFTIIDNPYEYFTVTCDGEAFMEDIILTGLQMLPMDTDLESYKATGQWPSSTAAADSMASSEETKRKSRKPSVDRKVSLKSQKKKSESTLTTLSLQIPAQLKYVLDFGGCELCALQKKSIVMVNNSEKVYKFTWANANYLVTQPTTGYISPGEEKDLEIMFYSAQPVVIERVEQSPLSKPLIFNISPESDAWLYTYKLDVGYLSYYSTSQSTVLEKAEFLHCSLVAVSDDSLTLDMRGATWDNRQIVTVFEHDQDISLNQRTEIVIDEQVIPQSDTCLGSISVILVYSAMTEYTKYKCTLPEEKKIRDTFIYQTRKFDFTVKNISTVSLKIEWSFVIDDEYPARLDKHDRQKSFKMDIPTIEESQAEEDVRRRDSVGESYNSVTDQPQISQFGREPSNVTLFSGSVDRQSVDTWFEIDLPFQIEPTKACLKSKESQVFTVSFSPLNAFDFKVKLKSVIDNLDPYDQNIGCKLTARSLIPYVHLDVEESDYLSAGRRKVTGLILPSHTTVLEFNVLGWGCYKKKFSVINPTSEAYEFIFEMVMSDKPDLIPVHCNMLKGYVEGGTSTEVTFTFSPTAPGVYESLWKFIIPVYNLVMNLLVVGLVREPDVVFVPTILVIRNSLVGFTSTHEVVLKSNEKEPLKFEFKGNSICNESGTTPVIVEPEQGTLKPYSETKIRMLYTPIADGPLSFKIFCSITYLMKYLTLCVNALSYSVNPKVTYYLIGHKHVLNSGYNTSIYLDQTASTYERTIPFTIMNNGSATFFFDWSYNISNVKEYLQVSVEPKAGHVTPGNEVECILHFTLKRIPVQGFPVKLFISEGPEYNIFLYAEIEKPIYNFSVMEYDFGKCFVNTPDTTYKKTITFCNGDKVPVLIHLNFTNLPELFVDYKKIPKIEPGTKHKIIIYFRPKQVKEYEFKLQFWVNSLCEEIVTIKGEGIPLLFDLYEGCQKSFDLGHVKVGEKIIRTIEVMNYSKMPIDASYIFREMYPVVGDTTNSDTTSVCLDTIAALTFHTEPGESRGAKLQNYKDDKIRAQIARDIENALSSLKVVPNKCTIRPFRKVPLKIQFKPVGMINTLNVQLNMKVFEMERPLVRLSGCATGMNLCLSQNSLQFGRVRKQGCKILKVMLQNKGDFGARFWWQPLKTPDFTISPENGMAAAHTNVTFTITYRPTNHNPFVKMWASCNIENYKPLELAMYATCVDIGNVQNKTLYLECPVREVKTDYIIVTNPTDDLWLVLSESSGGPFDTLKEFNIEPNSTFNIPVHFKPKTIGKHECQLLFSPLGESALFVSIIGVAQNPNPNGTIHINVAAKDCHIEELRVYNITEHPESYVVSTELVRVVPDKFEGYYEIQYPEKIKTWGEATATCRWTFVCYEICEMTFKVYFINEESREYQFYDITVTVTESPIVDTLTFVAPARESVQKELVVKNLLSEDSDYYIKSNNLIVPEVLTISRNSETVLSMTYSPLVKGVTEEFLEVTNHLVGTFIYKIILKCLPAKEKSLEATTFLGLKIPLRIRLHNKTDKRTDFTCEVSHESILADSQYALGPFEKGKFLVWFEPTFIGVMNIRVTFDSPVAGEFVFNVRAQSKRPKPQGPYEITAGRSADITFKNVFNEAKTFKMYVDKNEFYVKTLYEVVKPKAEIKIPVYLIDKPERGWPNEKKLPTATLTIETFEPPIPKVVWTYFLQAI